METNQTYKNRALASLEGKWTIGAVATLIFSLIVDISRVSIIYPMGDTAGVSVNGIWLLLCLPLMWGYRVFFLRLIRQEDIGYGHLFDGYKDCVRIGVTLLLGVFFVAIGCVFLLIPGIIISLMLSQVEFVMEDDKEIGYLDAMKRSVDLMKGHKAKLFWLNLSFIGWIILAILTFGIGLLLLLPYINTTLAYFYEDLKAEQQIG